MQVSFEFEVEEADRGALAAALGCTEAELAENLAKHGKAALHEYVNCYLGRRAFVRGSDILEYRLSLLAQHAFDNRIPPDSRVSQLFQTPLSASRTIIRNALSKFRYQLRTAADTTVKAILEKARWTGSDNYYLDVQAPNIIEVLNQRLVELNPTLASVKRSQGTAATYEINKHAYDKLCTAVGAIGVARPA